MDFIYLRAKAETKPLITARPMEKTHLSLTTPEKRKEKKGGQKKKERKTRIRKIQ